MKKLNTFFLLLTSILALSSCRSSKDLAMFQDLTDNVSVNKMPGKAPEYKIKPFDNLYLSVLTLDAEVNKLFNPNLGGAGFGSGTNQMYGDPTSQHINGYMVTTEGTITLPIIGTINLSGLNLSEAEELVKSKASEYLKDPNVKIKVLNFKINVTGEVRNPGIFYNYEGKLNIIDAISMANGISDFADIRNVLLIRQNDNIAKTYNLDFSDKSIFGSDAFYLQPNDIVYIKPNKYKGRSENNSLYSLFLSTISTLVLVTSYFYINK